MNAVAMRLFGAASVHAPAVIHTELRPGDLYVPILA
jgi:hypothetical protein